MRVLVTGASGFVGRHLVETLAHERGEAAVAGLVRPGTAAEGRIETIPCDLDDQSAVLRALERARPEQVVHLAAQSSPRLSLEDPEGTLRTNVIGLLHLLEAVRRLRAAPARPGGGQRRGVRRRGRAGRSRAARTRRCGRARPTR